jgi:alanyl aminopeptidase
VIPRRSWPAVALFLAACSGEPLPPPPPPAASTTAAAPSATADAPPPPALRLPRSATPVRYAVTLSLTPGQPRLEGEIDVDLAVKEPSRVLWLHAKALAVREARLEAGGRTLPARVVPGGEELVGFAFDEAVAPGPARLHVAYAGEISAKDDRGVFSEEEGGASYVFTQFESIEARRAFPCFDEPSYKVPWQLTLRVPAGLGAISNTPAVSTTREGATDVVRFAETKPLPSYLVAFAVGPFDVVDAGKAGKNKTPVRVAVAKGQAARAARLAKSTTEIVGRLEDLLGVPYPYEKLDVVAIPRTVTFGGMENAGLITVRARSVLASAAEDTSSFQLDVAGLMAHEAGHQWFGDLVTTAWWDDLWLNEAFASWIESKILVPMRPEWHVELDDVRTTSRAMSGDALVSARSIRQPIATADDIHNAFDEITYTKGASVIGMFEAYLGPERFRAGLRRYLTQHAHGNATAADLLAAVSAEAGRDIAPAFSTFLDQPGVPLVTAELSCKGSAAAVALAQERYFPIGSEGGKQASWQIPICVRWGRGKDEGRACTLLSEPRATLPLPEAKGCPAWVTANDAAAGYYHVSYGAKALAALLKSGKLSLADRAALVRDMRALVAGGRLPLGDALALLPEIVKDAHPQILRGAIDLVQMVRDPMIPEADRPRFARFVTKTFGARARAYGWQPKKGEDDQVAFARPALLRLVADRGADPAFAAEAEALAKRWLAEPASVDPDMVDSILATAAHRGDRAFFEQLRAAAKAAKETPRRIQLLTAMGALRDPALARAAREIALTGEHDARDAVAVVIGDPLAAEPAYAFMKEHFDAMLERLPGEWLGRLPRVVEPFCDEARRADAEAFFKPRAEKLPGGPRNVAKAVEKIHLCSALRAAQEKSLGAFLAKQ